MFRDTHMGSVLAWIGSLSVRWSCRVGKLLNRDGNPTPDTRLSVITFRCLGTPEAIRLGLVGVAIDRQYRDTPDLYLPYHAGNDSRPCVSNCLTGIMGLAESLRLVRM